MRQYRKKEKIFLKNSLSLDIDDFRLKGWMPVKITGCFLSGSYTYYNLIFLLMLMCWTLFKISYFYSFVKDYLGCKPFVA